jgi:HEAT repeat protein
MLEKDQFKIRSLRFARSLQTVIKMVNLFSAGHTNSVRPLQLSYDLLNALVKETRYLTIGFVDQRVLLNNILTTESTIQPLENEFLKRGIGAVTFDAGITLAAYKNVVSVLAANPKALEDVGGLLPFMEQRPLEFARIFPANKNQIRNDDGDTLLEMGSEEFLISKAMAEQHPGFSQGIDTVLSRVEQMGAFGVPGSGTGTGTGGGTGTGSAEPRVAGSGRLSDIQQAVDERFEALLQNPDEDPKKAYEQLAKFIKEIRPDYVLSTLAPNRGPSSLPIESPKEKEEVTAEVFEDAALRWAVQRLTTGPSGEDAVIVEEQVFRVLMRSLQTTHTASRLAHRLAEFAVEYALPRQTMERMQQEIRWMTLTTQQRLRELLGKTHFTIVEFQRLIELMKELINRGKMDDALALGNKYFAIFQNYSEIRIEEIGRIPDLLRTLGGISGEFRITAGQCLTEAVGSDKLNQVVHVQVVNALSVLAKTAALYEDFVVTHAIGVALEQSAARKPDAHRACCTATLNNLVPASAVDRILELLSEKRGDSTWTRMIAVLLGWSGASGVERLFAKLDAEPTAATRFVLIRLLARVGAAGLGPARQRLGNPEWYIARNACKILGELKDPELLQQIGPALTHHDPRVQQAAMKVLMESRMASSAAVVAQALPALTPSVQEEALNDLSFQSDPLCLPPLEAYLDVLDSTARTLPKVIQAITAIPGDAAADALARIATNAKFDTRVHIAARDALGRRPGLYAQCLLLELEHHPLQPTRWKINPK